MFPQSRMKYEKVHCIYNRLLAIEDIDPTLVCLNSVFIVYYSEIRNLSTVIFVVLIF